MTLNQRKLLRIIPLATIAVVLVGIGGLGKLSQLPALARWGLLVFMVFAFIDGKSIVGACDLEGGGLYT